MIFSTYISCKVWVKETRSCLLAMRYKKSSQMPLTNAWDTCIHLFQESNMAYTFQCEFGNSLRFKLSPELKIILQWMFFFPRMKKSKLNFAFPSIATLRRMWGYSQNLEVSSCAFFPLSTVTQGDEPWDWCLRKMEKVFQSTLSRTRREASQKLLLHSVNIWRMETPMKGLADPKRKSVLYLFSTFSKGSDRDGVLVN